MEYKFIDFEVRKPYFYFNVPPYTFFTYLIPKKVKVFKDFICTYVVQYNSMYVQLKKIRSLRSLKEPLTYLFKP